MISKLHILVSQREQVEGRRISDTQIANETGLNRATVSTYRTPNQVIDRIDSRVVTAFCNWAKCQVGDLLEVKLSQP